MLFAHALDYDVQRTCSKRFEHRTAVAPQAVFASGSNSCEIDGWRTLIHAEMGQHPKQMSKKFSSMASFKHYNFPCPNLLAAMGGQALKLKGHIKSKGPRCNQPSMLHESRVSQAHRWKGLAFSLQGHLAWIEMCSHIILPRGPFQLLHKYYSTAQRQHDMLFLPLADHVNSCIVPCWTISWEHKPNRTVNSIHIKNSTYHMYSIFCD